MRKNRARDQDSILIAGFRYMDFTHHGLTKKCNKKVINACQDFINRTTVCILNTMTDTVLVVEDDKPLQTFLKDLLNQQGYQVLVADDGVQAIKIIEKYQPDVTILDLGLPVMSGEAVCMKVRKEYPEQRIIILTAKDTVQNVVHGLELGADDYVTKPFVADELIARVEARIRRKTGTSSNVHQVGSLMLDRNTHEVSREGNVIPLTAQEFRLLEYLMEHKGRVVTRDMILNRIWSYSHDVETRVVDVYVGYLRKKVDRGYQKQLIQSVRGFGYMIKE